MQEMTDEESQVEGDMTGSQIPISILKLKSFQTHLDDCLSYESYL